MAAVDIAGFVADLKAHAGEHGFHVHDERHFVETYTLQQTWEIDIHPGNACEQPLDLHLSLQVEPRVLLGFEDVVADLEPGTEPEEDFAISLLVTWEVPPLTSPPDVLRLATDLAGIAGTELPLEISAIDSYAAMAEAERRLNVVGRADVALGDLLMGRRPLCEVFDRAHEVSEFLLAGAVEWLVDDGEDDDL